MDSGHIVQYGEEYFKVYRDIAQLKGISWNAKAIFAYLTDRCRLEKSESVEISFLDLGKALGISRQTAASAARNLERRALIAIDLRGKRPDRPTIDFPARFRVFSASKRGLRKHLLEQRAIREGKLTKMTRSVS